MFGPHGVAMSFTDLAKRGSKLQTGFIYHYAFVMIVGILFLLTVLTSWDSIQSIIFFDNRLLFILIVLLVLNLNKENLNLNNSN